MHKDFYASGFLYNLLTEQILLHQLNKDKNGSSSHWFMLGGKSVKGETPQKTFQRVTRELVKVRLDLKLIFPVYDYFHKVFNKTHFVSYAHIENVEKVRLPKNANFSWFTFKQASKLPFNEQTKQDMIVAERVIKLQVRNTEAASIASSSETITVSSNT